MYPVFSFHLRAEFGIYVRTSLSRTFPHDGQTGLSLVARSTLSSNQISPLVILSEKCASLAKRISQSQDLLLAIEGSASCNKRQVPRDALVVYGQLRAARNDNCVKGVLLGAGYQPGL